MNLNCRYKTNVPVNSTFLDKSNHVTAARLDKDESSDFWNSDDTSQESSDECDMNPTGVNSGFNADLIPDVIHGVIHGVIPDFNADLSFNLNLDPTPVMNPTASLLASNNYNKNLPKSVPEINEKETITMIKQRFIQTSDFEILEKTYKLSLKCPITRQRISLPARFKDCLHVECFDFEAFTAQTKAYLADAYKCPICRKLTPYSKLGIDMYTMKMLRENLSSITEVVIDENGKCQKAKPKAKININQTIDLSKTHCFDTSIYEEESIEKTKKKKRSRELTNLAESDDENNIMIKHADDSVIVIDETPSPQKKAPKRNEKQAKLNQLASYVLSKPPKKTSNDTGLNLQNLDEDDDDRPKCNASKQSQLKSKAPAKKVYKRIISQNVDLEEDDDVSDRNKIKPRRYELRTRINDKTICL